MVVKCHSRDSNPGSLSRRARLTSSTLCSLPPPLPVRPMSTLGCRKGPWRLGHFCRNGCTPVSAGCCGDGRTVVPPQQLRSACPGMPPTCLAQPSGSHSSVHSGQPLRDLEVASLQAEQAAPAPKPGFPAVCQEGVSASPDLGLCPA